MITSLLQVTWRKLLPVLASDVMADMAALLGDIEQDVFTNTVLLPYLQQASDDLQERLLAVSAASKINTRSDNITIPAGLTSLASLLPDDIIDPISVHVQDPTNPNSYTKIDPDRWERGESSFINTEPVDRIVAWTWRENDIYFNECSIDQVIFIRYRRSLTRPTGNNSGIDFPRTRLFLCHQAASLAAEFKGENPTRAASLERKAEGHWNRLKGTETKQQQKVPARRRPFRLRSQ